MAATIRAYREADRERLKAITIAAFPAASIDRLMETRHGRLGNTTWAERKAAAIDADCDANPAGVFVAEDERGAVLGYITCRVSRDSLIGWIPNMAVDPAGQNQGVGRRLLEHALTYFRAEGMQIAKIETLATNERGNHLYTSVGFAELVRQIHFTLALD